MMAVHDIKDYGDTDEMVYRDIFRAGHTKLTISIPCVDGSVSDKIYYLPSKDGFPVDKSVKPLLIKFRDYLQHKEEFSQWIFENPSSAE